MSSLSSTGCWRVKAVTIIVILGLLYLAKNALLDEAVTIPTTGGEGPRPSEGENKVLLSKSADDLTTQGPDPEGKTTPTGKEVPSDKDRLYPNTTQTLSMVQETQRERKGGRIRRIVSLPDHKSETIAVNCPSSICDSSNCIIVFPVFSVYSTWELYPENQYSWFRVAPEGVRMVLNTIEEMPPELWCSTIERFEALIRKEVKCTVRKPDYRIPNLGDTACTVTGPNSKTNVPSTPLKQSGGEVDSSKKALITPYKQTKTNSAVSLMLDYAHERNVSNCWLCQNMPESMHSPMFSPIPFTKADYGLVNWNDIASRISDEAGDCYTPSYPIDSEKPLQYKGLVSLIVDTVNKDYLPDGFKRLTFLKLIYMKKYVNLAFEYRFQLALAQTNCSANFTSPTCTMQPHTPALLVEALVTVVPWFGSRTVDSVEVKIHDCTQPIPLGKPPTRDCSVYVPPIVVHEWKNVSICFQNAVGSHTSPDVGHSDCNAIVRVHIARIPLPQRVYLVCGDRAYGCVPYDVFYGICYLAYLIPLIRKVEATEIAAILPSLHRNSRSITQGQQIASLFLPWYGIYVTQQEIVALSKVVEHHLNVSNTAMLAEHKELQEVRTVALQNRMALDLLLAAQGGTCKVIGSECCSFISDATPEVMDMAHDTARGIKELHETHGFTFGELSGTFGSWGAGLVKFVVTVSVFILVVLILVICLITVVKLAIRRVAKTALQAPQRLVGHSTVQDTILMYNAELPDPWVSIVISDPWVPPFND
ncbi:uncharacterized protein LOC117552405 [Gymnodraco acuticeps]|uniref:Uncharacterized protein LOC117552405 n=1 Tax=Gymnodraco acuticeps TaxID=8218 RepID=A0A6P8UV58_GYMAC|nr:uncharacterized protein LOC117552405 [Gymnodraco acuticeps]XP_034081669.1 uncharacterized protein LOC117552405 [Gymnodraco acuticeps]